MNDSQIKAADAEQLLNNPRLKQAFSNIKERITEQLEGTTADQANYRQELIVSLQVLKAIQQDIENDIDTGKLELAG